LTPETVPRVLIIAGPNGAGKTTFATTYLPTEADCITYLNADLIAQGLSPLRPEALAWEASAVMLELMDKFARRRQSFAFETTLSARSYAARIRSWRKLGYVVKLIYLRLSSAELAIARVANRVREGGHSVAEDVIRRRYRAGWRNFEHLYKPIVDEWMLFDNSGTEAVLLGAGAHQ
jgi:predicted ABC-type ATPase